MYKINGREGTITVYDTRQIIMSKIELPLWTIKSYRIIRLPRWRRWLNWSLAIGYAFVAATIIWYIQKAPVSAKLFLTTYFIGLFLSILKRYDDRKIINADYPEGDEHIVIYTEWGPYLVNCEGLCDKIKTFLDAYLSEEEKEKITEESTEVQTSSTLSPAPVPGSQ